MESMIGLVQEVARKDVVTFTNLIDLESAEKLRKTHVMPDGTYLTYTALITKAIALALQEYPEANRLVMKNIFSKKLVQLNSITATVACEKEMMGPERLVLTGMIPNVDMLSVYAVQEYLQKFRSDSSSDNPDWKFFVFMLRYFPSFVTRAILSLPKWSVRAWLRLRGGSFAITSPAKYGVDHVSAKWPYPLTFAFGLVKKRAIAVDEIVLSRLSVQLTMCFDRSLITGAPAARFFNAIKNNLENPQVLFD